MKSLKKIIAFFLLIFATGIFITVLSVNNTLKKEVDQETVTVSNDSLNAFSIKKKAV